MEEKRTIGPVIIRGGYRLDWVDSLRAFAVFCIVLGHTLRNATVVYPWLYCFHVPLCVMTSGIVFHHGHNKFFDFLRKKFYTLIIPYYCFALVSIVLYAFMGNMMEKSLEGAYNVSLVQSFYGMIYANSGTGYMRWNMPLWYLPMLFGLVILAWMLFWDTQRIYVDWMVLGGSILTAFVCYSYAKLDDLPFGFETAVYLLPFFAVGRLLARYMQQIIKMESLFRLMLGIGLVIIGTIMSIGEGQISYNSDSYGTRGYLYFVVLCTTLCIGFVFISTTLKQKIRYLSYIGRNTMGIMVMHKFPILFFVGLVPVTKQFVVKYPLTGSLLIACISIAFCSAVTEIIYRICPFILGKKRVGKT